MSKLYVCRCVEPQAPSLGTGQGGSVVVKMLSKVGSLTCNDEFTYLKRNIYIDKRSEVNGGIYSCM